ncbi:MAG: hypothetical protein ABH857_00035 [Elusimicrobiota bacterium]
MKKILLAIIVFIILPAFLYCAPDVTIKLETNNGSSTLNVTDSDNITVSSITSNGKIYSVDIIESGSGFKLPDGSLVQGSGDLGKWTEGAGNIIYYNTANVGIGTTNPAAKLDVNGSIETNYGVMAVTGVFSGAVTADRINVATVAATTNQGLRLVDDGGNLGLKVLDGGNIRLGAGRAFTLGDSADSRLFSMYYSAAPEMIFKNESGSKWTRFIEASSKNVLGIWGSGDSSGVIVSTYVASPPVKGLWVQGNVGIGAGNYGATTSELEVAGRIEASSSMKAPQINALDANGLKLYDDAANGIFIKDGGNVGIGTEVPTGKFDVYGGGIKCRVGTGVSDGIIVQSTTTLSRRIGMIPGDDNVGLIFRNDGTGHRGIRSDGSKFEFMNAGVSAVNPDLWTTIYMTLDSNGNLGIGTTAPTAKLDIIQSGSVAGLKVSGGTNSYMLTTNGTVINKLQVIDAINVGTIGNQTGHRLDVITNNTARISIEGGGNVGIGITNPVGLFQVGIGTMTVLSNGNVGIGTTNPTEKLYVNGNIRIIGTGTALPSASVNYRGTLYLLQGGTGVTDKLYLCMKTDTDTYVWVLVSLGN